MKIIIIGGVAGGASCAARLRRLDENAEIILLERGEYISYANCGLPYYIGDVIKSREALLVQTPETMHQKYNIDVRIKNEVMAIDRKKKTVSIRNTDTDETYEEGYDKLVIATGSSPVRPPIPGIDSPRIKTLWTVPDTDKIHALIQEQSIKSVAIIGGGFIGLEMAENLHRTGLKVSVIEMLNQVIAPLDYEMALPLHENIIQNGVNLYLGDGVDFFEDENDQVSISLKSGKKVQADLVILSIGVKPNSDLAQAAGLDLTARGHIVVDKELRTSDKDILAVGDVIEVEDFIFKDKTAIPLAGPANKQGRIAANTIYGISDGYEGTQGTSIVKVFDLTAASTGANEKSLQKHGLKKDIDYKTIIITQNSHAGYYPGATPMLLKLIFSTDGKKIYGAQIIGSEGVDKRIDTIAVTIRLGGSIHDLKKLELAYAPPFSSAKDPVNMAGFVTENVLKGMLHFSDWDAVEKSPEAILLDIREEAELLTFTLPHVVHIPLGQLRERLAEIEKGREIIIFCSIGVRSYNAARILMQNGFDNVKVYPGGTRLYQSAHIENAKEYLDMDINNANTASTPATSGQVAAASVKLDCSGMQCPGPIMKVFQTINTLRDGDILEVSASDPGFLRDIDAWCRRTGNTLLSEDHIGNQYIAKVQKGGKKEEAVVPNTADGKTIIVFSGDLDRVLASFIIANGAAAMGRPVTMFFTFWGLTVLRKPEKQHIKKTATEKMFGAMLPRGSEKLKLSKMNMGGMGTSMMKKIMNEKNVDSLEELIKKAMAAGVKIVACTMSMDIMGIRQEELIDGVELGGVGAYLGDAEESNVNLFI